MSVTQADPGWRGRALRFRIPDVIGQILIAVVGSYFAAVAAFELTMSVGALFASESHPAEHDHYGLYAATVVICSVPAMVVAGIPNIVWSCWQRRLSLGRALLAPGVIGLAGFALIGLGFFSARNLPIMLALHAPGIVAGCMLVAFTMYGWHRLWMQIARRHAA